MEYFVSPMMLKRHTVPSHCTKPQVELRVPNLPHRSLKWKYMTLIFTFFVRSETYSSIGTGAGVLNLTHEVHFLV
jgi:hypothetical protein